MTPDVIRKQMENLNALHDPIKQQAGAQGVVQLMQVGIMYEIAAQLAELNEKLKGEAVLVNVGPGRGEAPTPIPSKVSPIKKTR